MQQEILNKIKSQTKITIFYHQRPDPDAWGSAFGLKQFISENFNCQVKVANKNLDISTIPTHLIEYVDEVEDEFIYGSLGIVVDTANKARIFDNRWTLCKEIIKIDHHPNKEPYGTEINFVDTSKSSTAELLLTDIMMDSKFTLSKKTLIPLFTGIITDTGRFRFNPNASTFKAAAYSLENGVDAKEIYDSLYQKNINDVKVTGAILSNAKVEGRVMYCVLPKETEKELDVPRHRLKQVNVMADIKDIDVWVLTYFEPEENQWKVSVRSKGIPINTVCEKYNGGGHAAASGAIINNLKEFQSLIYDLNWEIKNFKK